MQRYKVRRRPFAFTPQKAAETVQEYIDRFHGNMDQLNLPEEAAISLFSGNLRPEFKDMQILTATSILHVFDAALLKESLVRESRDSVPRQLQSDVQALK